MQNDIKYMKLALAEAKKALVREEVPIGAVVVCQQRVIGRGYNLKETTDDPTAHAEIIALREAARKSGSWRLSDCQLYATVEPCPMCAGAILQARIKRLVYGVPAEKAGAVDTLYNLLSDNRFNHTVEVKGGVMAEESRELLQKFFQKLREND